jgi:hypothetical protein
MQNERAPNEGEKDTLRKAAAALDGTTEGGSRDPKYEDELDKMEEEGKIHVADDDGRSGEHEGGHIIIGKGVVGAAAGGPGGDLDAWCDLLDLIAHEVAHRTAKRNAGHEGFTYLRATQEVCFRYPLCCRRTKVGDFSKMVDFLEAENPDVPIETIEGWAAIFVGPDGRYIPQFDAPLPSIPRGCGGMPVTPPDPDAKLEVGGGGGRRVAAVAHYTELRSVSSLATATLVFRSLPVPLGLNVTTRRPIRAPLK